MTEAFRATSLAAAALAWLSISAARTDASSPARLVAELRLAQLAALLLVLVAGAYVGFAITHETRVGTGLDISLTVGFFVIAAVATTQDPRVALTALAFGAHAVVDVLHRGGVLSDNLAPAWYVTWCAIYDVLIAGLCYLPVLRR